MKIPDYIKVASNLTFDQLLQDLSSTEANCTYVWCGQGKMIIDIINTTKNALPEGARFLLNYETP